MNKLNLVRQILSIKIREVETELNEKIFKLDIQQDMSGFKIRISTEIELEEYVFYNYFNEEDSIEEVKELLHFAEVWIKSVFKIAENM